MKTSPRQKILLSWSSGKDSAWALHVLRQQPGLEVVGLLTTFNEAFDRVAMHAVRRELVEAQAAAANLPLVSVMLPYPCTNEVYEDRMKTATAEATAIGCHSHCVRRPVPRRHPAVPDPTSRGNGREAIVPDLDHGGGHARPGSTDAGCRLTGGPDLRGSEPVERAVRRSAVRRGAAGGPTSRCRSLRRTGRVSHVLLPLPGVQP